MVRKTVKMMMAGAAAFALMSGSAYAADIVGLITKTNNNPFFVKMKEGAEGKAKELGVTLQSFAGKFDGDNDSQVAARAQATPLILGLRQTQWLMFLKVP